MKIVRPGTPMKQLVDTLFVSSMNDQHPDPRSRHVERKAIDSSRINGKRIADYDGKNPLVTKVVQRIQREFEACRDAGRTSARS